MCACVCVGLLRIVGIYFCAFLSLWDAYVEGRCARAYVCVRLLRSPTSSYVDMHCKNLHSLYFLLFQAVHIRILCLLMLYLLFGIVLIHFFAPPPPPLRIFTPVTAARSPDRAERASLEVILYGCVFDQFRQYLRLGSHFVRQEPPLDFE